MRSNRGELGISKVSLYKLKREYDIFANNISSDCCLVSKSSDEDKWALYICKPIPMIPKWFKFFNDSIGNIDLTHLGGNPPEVKYSGFILFVQMDSSIYACCGGNGYYSLTRTFSIEARFGIEIAKRILRKKNIKGLIQKDTGGIVNSLDRVFRGKYDPDGDIDNLHRVLTNIRAKADKKTKLYAEIGSSIRAGDSLSVTGKKNFSQLIDFVKNVDKIYSTENKTLNIPELEAISAKYEKELIETLWAKLIEYISGDNDSSVDTLFLDNLDVGFLPDTVNEYIISYRNSKKTFYTCSEVFKYLKELFKSISNPLPDLFDIIKIKFVFDSEDSCDFKPIRHYICGDIIHDNEFYFLNNENWYRANLSFINKVNQELNEIIYCLPPERLFLNEWQQKNEDEYNKSHESSIILDKHLVRIKDEKGPIEFCDLLNFEGSQVRLIHVKHACGAELRALFAQGFVSAKLYSDSDEFKNKILAADISNANDLSLAQKQKLAELTNRNKSDFLIVYAIYDDTQKHKVKEAQKLSLSNIFEGTITLFAKIDLLSRVQELKGMGYQVAVTRIKPYPAKNKIKILQKSETEV